MITATMVRTDGTDLADAMGLCGSNDPAGFGEKGHKTATHNRA